MAKQDAGNGIPAFTLFIKKYINDLHRQLIYGVKNISEINRYEGIAQKTYRCTSSDQQNM